MIIADTSGLLALFNRREPAHDAVRTIVEAESDPLVVSPFVVAELDSLVGDRLGVEAELLVLEELAGGAYDLPACDGDDLRTAASLVRRYADLHLGVADASLIVLAARYRTRTVLTLDHRHFAALRPLDGGRFTLVP